MSQFWQPWEKNRSLQFSSLFFLAVMLCAGILFYLYTEEEQGSRQRVIDHERFGVYSATMLFREAIVNEVNRALIVTNILTEKLHTTLLSARKDANFFAHDIAAALINVRSIDKIRLLNLAGREELRVERRHGQPYVVPPSELKDQSQRYYYKNTLNLPPGHVYISPLDLTVENGKVKSPFEPVLRIVVTVLGQEQEKLWVLVINILADKMLAVVSDYVQWLNGDFSLLNQEGYWLLGPDKARLWAFMFPESKHLRFAHFYPEIWNGFVNSLSRQASDVKEGSFVSFKLDFSGEAFGTPGKVVSNSGTSWTEFHLVSHLSPKIFSEKMASARTEFMVFAILSGLCIAAASWYGSGVLQHRRRCEEALSETRREMTTSINERTVSLEESQNLLRLIMNAVDANMVVLDHSGTIVAANQAWVDFGRGNDALRQTEADWVGVNYLDVCRNVQGEEQQTAASVVERLEQILVGQKVFFQKEYAYRTSTDEQWFILKAQRLKGKRARMVIIHYPITAHKKAEKDLATLNQELESQIARRVAELQQSRDNLEISQRIASLGSWEWHVASDTMTWSSEVYQLYGLVKLRNDQPTLEKYLSYIHPLDQHRVRETINNLVIDNCNSFEEQYRVVRSGGDVRTVREVGHVYRDAEGKDIRVLGTVQDITQRELMEQKLRESVERFATLAASAPVGVYQTDPNGRYTYVNQQWCVMTGISSAGLLEEGWVLALHHDDRETVRVKRSEAMGETRKFSIEYRLLNKNGTAAWVHDQAVPQTGGNGSCTGYIGTLSDITAAKRNEYMQANINNLLYLALDADDLPEKLQKAIQSILDLRLFPHVHGGAVFLFDAARQELVLTAQQNMPAQTRQHCQTVKLNQCLCGAAAALMEVVLAQRDDPRLNPSVRYVESYWHYSVPIISAGELLGVLVMHLKPGYSADSTDTEYLTIVANTLAGMIQKQRVDQKLMIAKDEAESANQAKSDFLANMSHEIRTPLHALISLGHLLGQTALSNQQLNYVTKIDLSAKSLLAIVNDILDFSKIESGKMDLEAIEFSLKDLLDHLIPIIQNQAEKKRLEFIVEVYDKTPLLLVGDSLRLEQILTNLCVNAVKFTTEGTVLLTMDFYAEHNESIEIIFAVRDTGIGITDQQKNEIFSAFSQADTSTTRKYGGTGLGLAICSRLVTKMAGKLWVESQLGSGSSFKFTARFRRAHTPGTWFGPVTADLKGKRLLVVDDNPDVRQIVARYLQIMGIATTLVSSGAEAITLLQRSDREDHGVFDMILLDLVMPNMSGLAAIRAIRQLPGMDKARFCLMMPTAEQEKLRYSLRRDGIAMLTKPVMLADLWRTVTAVLAGQLLTEPLQEMSRTPSYKNLYKFMNTHILLVEDHPINQEVAKDILEGAGIQVDLAENGREAIVAVEQRLERPYDIILMDIQMPEMDGYEATQIMSQRFPNLPTPIVAMTANALERDHEQCLRAGMRGYVTKPIDVAILFQTLADLLPPSKVQKQNPGDATISLEASPLPLASSSEPLSLPGLDMVTAMKRVRGKKELYAKLLESFTSRNLRMADQISSMVTEGRILEAANLAHGVQGVAGNLAAMDLHHAARELEHALRSNQLDACEPLLSALREAMRVVIASAQLLQPTRPAEDE